MEIEKRKVKVLYIDKGQVFDIVTTLWTYDKIQLPDYTGLFPKDYKVRDVFYEPSRNAFGFVIFSSTFEPVEPGHSIPVIITVEQKNWIISLTDPKIRRLLGLGR